MGVYDIIGNTGWVSVGVDHDSGQRDPLLVARDGARSLSKRAQFADELGLTITLCHLHSGARE